MTDISCIFLVGPTGAGKTAASLRLAKDFHGAVVNLDSRQVYRDFPLITAQPSSWEQSQCPHELYGFAACQEKMTAGRFVSLAREAIIRLARQELRPLLVGGTGLYMRSLLEGLAPIPAIDPQITQGLEREAAALGLPALYERLQGLDPAYAAKIHPNDKQRILRALEVEAHTGHILSWWHERPVPPQGLRGLKIGLRVSLEELKPLLARRIDMMLEAGALEEARRALQLCPNPEAPGWSGIGCAELHAHLAGNISLDEAKELWFRNTKAYAKRQMTWFKKDKDIHWFAPDDLDGITALAARFLDGVEQ